MKREKDRYLVVKYKGLDPNKQSDLIKFLERAEINTVECVVVESKDSELYEKVWIEIEARETNKSTQQD